MSKYIVGYAMPFTIEKVEVATLKEAVEERNGSLLWLLETRYTYRTLIKREGSEHWEKFGLELIDTHEEAIVIRKERLEKELRAMKHSVEDSNTWIAKIETELVELKKSL